MLHRTHSKAVPAVVVVGWIHSSAIEVQVEGVRRIVERTTPVVAVRTPVIEGRAIAVSRGREESCNYVSVVTYYDYRDGILMYGSRQVSVLFHTSHGGMTDNL